MLAAIQHLLDIKVIEPVPQAQKGKGVYSIFFLVPKKNGEVRGDTAPEVVKSLPSPMQVQDGDLAINCGGTSAQRLLSVAGFLGGLPACANPPQGQMLSPFLLWLPSLSILNPPFWTGCGSQGLHKDLGGRSGSSSPAGDISIPVSRRCSDLSSISGTGSQGRPPHSSESPEPAVCAGLRKEFLVSSTVP